MFKNAKRIVLEDGRSRQLFLSWVFTKTPRIQWNRNECARRLVAPSESQRLQYSKGLNQYTTIKAETEYIRQQGSCERICADDQFEKLFMQLPLGGYL